MGWEGTTPTDKERLLANLAEENDGLKDREIPSLAL